MSWRSSAPGRLGTWSWSTGCRANITPAIYVIGGAADFRPDLFMNASDRADYTKARDALRVQINADGESENPLPGFAAAAFMGSEFARKCFRKASGAGGVATFDEQACMQ